MKTKAEQIEELKATAVELQQQIEALEKPKQWKPRGNYRIKLLYEDAPTMLTIEAAEKASDAMRTHNRLLAYVDEFGGDWEADWSDDHKNYYVCYAHLRMAWSATMSSTTCTGGTVYMSEECAKDLAAKLNSGEVRL